MELSCEVSLVNGQITYTMGNYSSTLLPANTETLDITYDLQHAKLIDLPEHIKKLTLRQRQFSGKAQTPYYFDGVQIHVYTVLPTLPPQLKMLSTKNLRSGDIQDLPKSITSIDIEMDFIQTEKMYDFSPLKNLRSATIRGIAAVKFPISMLKIVAGSDTQE